MEDSFGREFQRKYRKDTKLTAGPVDIIKAFRRAMRTDEDRVSFNNNAFELLFDPADTGQFRQFNSLGYALNEEKVAHTVGMKGALCSVAIPLDEKDFLLKQKLLYIARVITADIMCKPAVRPLTPKDPEYTLVSVTGVPWNKVEESDYGVTTLEPVREVTVNDFQRWKEESALGRIMAPDGTFSSRARVEDWITYQRKIEAERNVPVHTAIPEEWAEHGHADRVTVRREMLRKMFKGKEAG